MSTNGNTPIIEYNISINRIISDIWSPIFNTNGFKDFFHIKIYFDGRIYYTSSHLEWIKYYINHNLFEDESHHIFYTPPSITRYSLWDEFKGDRVFSSLCESNIWNGFTIYEHSEDGVTIYSFGCDREKIGMRNWFINNLARMKNYIDEYKNKVYGVITENPESFIKINIKHGQNNIYRHCIMCNGQEVYLSKREHECLMLLAKGNSAKEIARKLGPSYKTIESYLQNIREKTGHHTKADLVRLYMENLH